MPAGATELGEGTGIFTAPAAEVQATLETSGITFEPGVTPTEAGQGEPSLKPVAEAISQGHAFDKHVLNGEFKDLGITTPEQFSEHVSQVMGNAEGANVRVLSGERIAYWDDSSGTVVIFDPNSPDLGTAFRPPNGRAYFDGSLR